jgi:hypothetical protein
VIRGCMTRCWSDGKGVGVNHDNGRRLAQHFHDHPEDYESCLPGNGKSGVHGSVVALAKQLVLTGEATDLAHGIGIVLAESPGLYDKLLEGG